jgi:hypothetical protein
MMLVTMEMPAPTTSAPKAPALIPIRMRAPNARMAISVPRMINVIAMACASQARLSLDAANQRLIVPMGMHAPNRSAMMEHADWKTNQMVPHVRMAMLVQRGIHASLENACQAQR